MDLTRDVIYRTFYLNDPGVHNDLTAGSPISGCVLDGFDLSDVDVMQFSEKRSQMDGMDAGDVWQGGRRIRISGTLYGSDRGDLFDRLWNLRRALNPVLAQREEPGDKGYRPLYFSVPTNDADYDADGGVIELMVKAMPRAFSASIMRDVVGGEDTDALALPWQATLVCRDPSIMSAVPVDTNLTTQTLVTGATAQNTGDTITSAGHGLVAGDRVRITAIGSGAGGLSTTTTYYVVSPATDTFKVSLTDGGAAVAITSDGTGISWVKSSTSSGTVNNRGNYIAPVNALWVVGTASGQISATVGDATFTVTVPSSTYDRILRFKGEDKVFTLEETAVGDPSTSISAEVPRSDLIVFTNETTWPYIDAGPGQSYSFTHHGCAVKSGSHWWFYERYA